MDQAPPMETLFNSLRHLRGISRYSFYDVEVAPAHLVADLIDVFRRGGDYDPRLRVGPHQLPLLHALSRDRELPVDWLTMFASNAKENLLFDRIEGETIGSFIFKKAMQKDELESSPCLEWWIANVPSMDAQESATWVDALSRVNGSNAQRTTTKSVENAQTLIKALMERGAKPSAHEPGRPQERWSRKPVWWEKIREDGRLDELVLCPSGRRRAMRDLMGMGGLDKSSGFAVWLKGQDKTLVAPHGRRKELLEGWVLGDNENIPASVRAQRLAASIVKTEGVLEEMGSRSASPSGRKADIRPALRELLLHRTPSGMTLRTWFFLNQEKEKYWPRLGSGLMGEDFDAAKQWWLAPDGAGIILQKVRAAVGNGEGEFPGAHAKVRTSLDRGVLGHQAQLILAGDPSTHAELVDLLVDSLVAPSANAVSTQLTEMVLANGFLVDAVLSDKLRQAFDLRQLRYCIHNADASHSYGTVSNKDKAAAIAQTLNDQVDRGGWGIALSGRDWSTLFNEWKIADEKLSKLGPITGQEVKKLLGSLVSIGDRLAVSESTPQAQSDGQVAAVRPRL